jgi:hypothetical protein
LSEAFTTSWIEVEGPQSFTYFVVILPLYTTGCIFESSTAVVDCEDCWAKYYCVRRGTRRKSSSEVTSIESDR